MTEEEWGPWIKHDGMGPPVPPGVYVHVVSTENRQAVGYTSHTDEYFTYWHKDYCIEKGLEYIVRYRVRKPKGLTMLQGILKEVEKTDPSRQNSHPVEKVKTRV